MQDFPSLFVLLPLEDRKAARTSAGIRSGYAYRRGIHVLNATAAVGKCSDGAEGSLFRTIERKGRGRGPGGVSSGHVHSPGNAVSVIEPN